MREGRVEGQGGEDIAEMCTSVSTGKRVDDSSQRTTWMPTILMLFRVEIVGAVAADDAMLG